MIGNKYNMLTVIAEAPKTNNSPNWLCRCDCGNEKIIRATNVRRGVTKSCGCLSRGPRQHIAGLRFGRLIVLKQASNIGDKIAWFCKCDCGNHTTVTGSDLITGHTKSCGCYRRDLLVQSRKDLTGLVFGKLTVVSENFTKKRVAWNCLCECGTETVVTTDSLNSGNTMSCGCIQSKGEEIIANLLYKNNINFKKEYSFSDLISDYGLPLRFDFAIFDNDKILYLIEYDGPQHTQTKPAGYFTEEKLDIIKYHDRLKNNYCNSHQIPLIRIPYTQLKKIIIDDLLLDRSKFIYNMEASFEETN